MNLFDTHCHLNFGAFRDDADGIIDESLSSGMYLLNVGTNLDTSKRAVQLAEQHDQMWAAIGLHPIHLARDITEKASFDGKNYQFTTKAESWDKRRFFELVQSKKVVAVGESGLDYFHLEDFAAAGQSQEAFIALQKDTLYEILGFAREVGLPHVFHCRDAYDDFYDIVKQFNDNSDGASGSGGQVRGTVHCFTGNRQQATKMLDLGLYIGFTGIVTFPSAKELQAVAKLVPLDRLLLETDSPFLAPQPVRGQRNKPPYIRYVAEKIAELKGLPVQTVINQTTKNAQTLFGIEV